MEDSNEARMHQRLTRTIAILAGEACNTHRLAIQEHITQNGFTILSERVEQWSIKNDQDFLTEFLRDEANMNLWMQRLTDAQIYVMVLEGQDVENGWLTLCGPDLDKEKEESSRLNEDGLPIVKSGLRARYGAATLYGSSVEGAPRQIAICFPDLASFEALDALHAEGEEAPNTIAAMGPDGRFLVRDELDIAYDERGQAFDVHTGEAIDLQPGSVKAVAQTKSTEGGFKARPSPSSTKKPTIQPRLSKAAALRMGVTLPDIPKREVTKASASDENLGISGLPRANIALPKSLMAPSIAPRLNRVAAARTNATPSVTEVKSIVKEKKAVDYSNTPGHKRVSLSAASPRPASLAAPTVMPRLNKAATARLSNYGEQERDGHSSTAPSSIRTSSCSISPTAIRKPIDFSGTPGHKRVSPSTSTIKSLQAPTLAPRSNRASIGRTGGALVDGASIANISVKSDKEVKQKKIVDYSNTPGHKRASTGVSISSLAQPSIAPRINAAAMKRMSIGAILASDAATAQLAKPRPMVTNGNMNSSSAATRSSSRPSSRVSLSSAHQDGALPRNAPIRRNAAPPSSFRM